MLEEKNLPDEEILRISLKDPSYFAILVDKYQTPFIRKAIGIVRNKDEAEDIVQEITSVRQLQRESFCFFSIPIQFLKAM